MVYVDVGAGVMKSFLAMLPGEDKRTSQIWRGTGLLVVNIKRRKINKQS